MAVGNGKKPVHEYLKGELVAGGLRGLLKGGKNYEQEAQKIVEKLKEDYPFVAEILGGLPATQTDEAVAPGTITIYIHEGRARFTCNVKSSSQTIFGEVGDIVNIWASIDLALLTGQVSSKRFTERVSASGNEADIPH